MFRREGPHLIVEYPISIAQAGLGADVEIPTMNGRVSMKIPAGTQTGTVFRVRGKGLSDVQEGGSGDLLVRVVVETPSNLTSAQRRLLEEVGKTLGDEAYPSRRSFLAKLRDLLKNR